MRSIFLGVSKRAKEVLVLFSVSTYLVLTEKQASDMQSLKLLFSIFVLVINRKDNSEMSTSTSQQVCDGW